MAEEAGGGNDDAPPAPAAEKTTNGGPPPPPAKTPGGRGPPSPAGEGEGAPPSPPEGGDIAPGDNPLMSYFDDAEADGGGGGGAEADPPNGAAPGLPAQDGATAADDGGEGGTMNGEGNNRGAPIIPAGGDGEARPRRDAEEAAPPPDDPPAPRDDDDGPTVEGHRTPPLDDRSAARDGTSDADDDVVNVSPNSLVEAERQAAIAAAISASAAAAPPSVAAGIARALALPPGAAAAPGGDAGGRGGPPHGRTTTGGRHRHHPPPPPPPRTNFQAGPTLVALPPLPLPPPNGPKRAGQMMRPVRFDDVKAAFAALATEGREREERGKGPADDGAGGAAGVSSEGEGTAAGDAKEDVPGPGEEEEGNDPAFKRTTTEELEGAEEGLAGAQADGEPGEAGRTAEGGDGAADAGNGNATDEEMAEEGEEPASAAESEAIHRKGDDVKKEGESAAADEEDARAPPSPDPKREEEATEANGRAPVPDAFLRFLLLVARVPIIVEERPHPAASPSAAPAAVPSAVPSAAAAAARRAHAILNMARTAYEEISERERRRGASDAGGDATAAFFAACAGEEGTGEEDRRAEEDAADGPCDGRPPTTPPLISSSTSGAAPATTTTTATAPLTATASSMASSASAAFTTVLSKMSTKKSPGGTSSFADLGKKFMMSGSPGSPPQRPQSAAPMNPPARSPSGSPRAHPPPHDYEVLIDREMLGLTVENVLERTVIRTLLPDGAAQKAGARVGSLIAKVGNVDTSNLTHFETIDELRQAQRPLRLTLRHVGGDVLRRAREEMGRLIRGRGVGGGTARESGGGGGDKPWRETAGQKKKKSGETFDSVLSNRWPSTTGKAFGAAGAGGGGAPAAPPAMSRAEALHRAGAELIRILALLVVGLQKELSELDGGGSEGAASIAAGGGAPGATNRPQRLSAKELGESIESTSKILHDYARGLPDVDEKGGGSGAAGGPAANKPPHRAAGSSFYPVPPGRVQGKKHSGPPPPPPPAGRGAGRGRGAPSKGKKGQGPSPLLRIGDALSRTRSFLVESSSATATALRWEIVDHLCTVLDLDTEQELSEKESASSSAGEAGPDNDLGSAGSILKLIVLNCSTADDGVAPDDDASQEGGTNGATQSQNEGDELETSSLDRSLDRSSSTSVHHSHAGNPFLSVVHRLAASKSTSARVSACSLGPVLWSHLDFPRQLQLRGVITRALHDVEVIVRKSTAAVLHEIAELVFDRRAVPWLVLMCERSMTDPEPQLRAAAMTLTWHLAEHLPNAFLGDASMGSRSIRRLPPRDSPTFMDVYLLQCKLLPVANNLAEDKVASVRLSVAAQCDRLCNAMGEHWHSVIIDLLQALLSDGDERVRSEAILCVPRLVESVIVGSSSKNNITVLESLLPLALKIQKDASPLVRSSLATATGELLIFLVGLGGDNGSIGESAPPSSPGKTPSLYEHHKKHVDDTLIPILQKLLQDSDPEVTTASLRAVTNASRSGTRDATSTHVPSCHHHNIDDDLVSLSSHHSHHSHASHERTRPVFIPVLSETQILQLLPTLSNLATSAQWRVRQSAVEIVPALMGCTSRNETRHEVSKLCLTLMNDKVDAVRKTAAECLCLGGSSLARHGVDDGGEWITQICIPHLKTCSQSEDSKQRQLSLKMIEILITNGLCPSGRVVVEQEARTPESPRDDESLSSRSSAAETPLRTILNIAASHTSDSVANVRLNVGRTFGAVMLFLDRPDVEFAVGALEKQLEEEACRPGGGDRDVIYFAQQAISLAQPLRRMSSNIS